MSRLDLYKAYLVYYISWKISSAIFSFSCISAPKGIYCIYHFNVLYFILYQE